MANMFRCTLASGGGALVLTVTSDSAFAGQTITCTDGTTTLTQICPSTSPYTVEFKIPNGGTWTISSGTASTSVVIPDSIGLHDIPNGSTITPINDIQIWLHCANIWDKSYTTITQVLNDASTLQALIASNNAADYMARSTTWASSVTANQTAMSYIGLNDYCANKLLANSTWRTAICNSTYFESVLNVKVPTMTSNTAPYGTASANSAVSGFEAYKMFDKSTSTYWGVNNASAGNYAGYTFTNPICVKAIEIFTGPPSGNNYLNTFKVQASNDGFINDVHDLTGTLTVIPQDGLKKFSISNDDYYLSYRIYALSSVTACYVNTLQFYGRT